MPKFFDPDFRRTPKTDRYCAACGKDIKGKALMCRVIDDCAVAMPGEIVNGANTDEIALFGPDCAKRIGMEYFTWV